MRVRYTMAGRYSQMIDQSENFRILFSSTSSAASSQKGIAKTMRAPKTSERRDIVRLRRIGMDLAYKACFVHQDVHVEERVYVATEPQASASKRLVQELQSQRARL